MLVLTRKASQQIQVGENIVITILNVKGNSVRIGIEAPRDVRVMRGELEPKTDGRPAPETEVTAEMAVVPQRVENRLRSASARGTSPKQAPLDVGLERDARQAVIMRFPVAEASTDAPSDFPVDRYERRSAVAAPATKRGELAVARR
jgi:carbon storage regulator CsrA